MKLREFNYKKQDDVESKKVFVFNESERYIEGIDISKLTEDEYKQFALIQSDYEQKIKAFVAKGYRKYLKEKIEDDAKVISG